MTAWVRSLAVVMAVIAGAAVVAGAAGVTRGQSPRTGPSRAPTPPPPAADVQRAIDRAKAYLYAQQQPDGTWETVRLPSPAATSGASTEGLQWGGLTAVATYALLATGENPADPRLTRAIEFLRSANQMAGVYAVGMRAQVWQYLPETPENRRAVLRDGQLLLNAMNRSGAGRGLFRYNTRPDGGWDHSASQIAVLGLWALTERQFEVPLDVWRLMDSAWRANQRNGGWAYDADGQRTGNLTPAMTAAGAATLFLTQDFLGVADALQCRGNLTDKAIDDAVAWLAGNLSRVESLYAWYGVERVGVASGRKYFGTADWYALGARRLLQQQRDNGSWDGMGGGVPNTAFGLLFLVRGRAPTVMSKLDYELAPARPNQPAREGPWNQRPRDAANVTRFVSRQLERPLNWQITRLDSPVEELLDSPILYIAGNQPLQFTDEQENRLREYVLRGGLILAHADCSASSFAQSVRQLGKKLFPSYDFSELPDDHPLYTRQQFPRSAWRQRPVVQSLGNGVRELIVLLPTGDAARAWHANDTARLPVFQLIANLHLYTTDKLFARTRGETYLLGRTGSPPTRRLAVARLRYDGNWDPEPAGWERLDVHLSNTHRLGLDVASVEVVALRPPTEGGPRLAHLTGTHAVAFPGEVWETLKRFVDGGGVLLIDAAGGRDEFGASLEDPLVEAFGDGMRDILPLEHPLYATGGRSGQPVPWPAVALPVGHRGESEAARAGEPTPGRLLYRDFARTRLSAAEARQPRLRGRVDVGPGKGAVLFSREDLSAGLVGQPVDGIFGYAPEVALHMLTRVALWADGQRPSPAQSPTPAQSPPPAQKPAPAP